MNARVASLLLLSFAALLHANPPARTPATPSPRQNPPPGAPAQGNDAAQIDMLRQLFERAVNENNFDLIAPYIDKEFKGTSVAGTDLAGVEQIREFMQRARQLMGKGSHYHLNLDPRDLKIDGDSAKAGGTTREHIDLPDGQKLDYKSDWSIDLKKKDGKWAVTKADTQVDMRDKLTIAAHVVASRIWQAGLNLKRVRLWRPDWDQDNGFHKPEGVDSPDAAESKDPKKEGLQKPKK